ncbi:MULTISPECIES: outer membrane protein OmpK [Shewanella]|uniref:Ion channel protein Tsx n=2 Tax=Unclassified Bacteria TaxID=49928 RepID=A0AAU6VSH5_UNCXX|nr:MULTISPECIES: outer membrane protein OmpK [Shewanella]MCT8979881.1 ion channel protein Tsx [Shewanella algae]MDE0565614.1 ion channel protein Tsx [Shewanella sp. K8]TVO83659.1 ion channel protein Tsx [Shewanella algae]TVO85227.1 ion channel protein Tsx [Shewanella algae]TVO96960.1 ion channel protein Tsx [Shewanella algae]
MKKICLCAALLFSPQAFSEPLVQWWDVNITALYGQDYDLAPSDKQTTFTLETAGGWKYGDWFVFQDFINFNGHNGGKDSTTYGEISTRFSAGKILGKPVGFGPVTDLSLALTLEEGEGPVETLLYGIGMDLKLPYFTYFQLNTYRRDAQNSANISDGWQLTPVFRIDIPVGNSKIVFDGFIDWVFAAEEDGYKENIHINPQIKYDLGAVLFGEAKKDKFLVGIEYDYWQNKYGVDGVDQNTYSVIAQYHF